MDSILVIYIADCRETCTNNKKGTAISYEKCNAFRHVFHAADSTLFSQTYLHTECKDFVTILYDKAVILLMVDYNIPL